MLKCGLLCSVFVCVDTKEKMGFYRGVFLQVCDGLIVSVLRCVCAFMVISASEEAD